VINTTIEKTAPLAKAARGYSSPRGEGSYHPSALHRWRTRGIRGIKLECIKVGGVWHTSVEALQRFFEQVTALEAEAVPAETTPAAGTTRPPQGTAHQLAVAEELDAVLGVAAKCGTTSSGPSRTPRVRRSGSD
jgi:hypothetical protein